MNLHLDIHSKKRLASNYLNIDPFTVKLTLIHIYLQQTHVTIKVARAFQKKVIRSQPNLVENKIMMLQTCRDNKNDNRPTRFHFIKPHI